MRRLATSALLAFNAFSCCLIFFCTAACWLFNFCIDALVTLAFFDELAFFEPFLLFFDVVRDVALLFDDLRWVERFTVWVVRDLLRDDPDFVCAPADNDSAANMMNI